MGCADSQMADRTIDRYFLLGYLGRDVGCAHSLQQGAYMVTACVRRWPRCP